MSADLNRTGWSRRVRLMSRATAAILVCAAVLLAVVVWLNLRGEESIPEVAVTAYAATFAGASAADTTQIARGDYLARAGNCVSCHTATGGQRFAGGRPIETPFGAVYASNLTPDRDTGIGSWTSAHFWRAMHHGRSKDGRLLYPAFPYTSYTHVTRQDSDAIFAYLHSQAPVARANTAHTLRFPYDTQLALATWRALFFRADPAPSGSATPAAVISDPVAMARERGRYLVDGLGHCSACHAARNALGATVGQDTLGGGLIPLQNWYAPALNAPNEAGMADWSIADISALLHTGRAPGASVAGPMAEVVFKSTQFLDPADLSAMATYLKSLPQHTVDNAMAPTPPAPAVARRGLQIYDQQCAQCHGAQGEGTAGAFPALAGNRAITMPRATNVIQTVLRGGYLPATDGNPMPHGMPPFVQTLDDAEIAAVITHIRTSWGNAAEGVGAVDVFRIRSGN